MVRCDICDNEPYLPYNCVYCGGRFCDSHRLPEKHGCANIPKTEDGWFALPSDWDKYSHRLDKKVQKKFEKMEQDDEKRRVKKQMRKIHMKRTWVKRSKLKNLGKILLVVLLLCGGLGIAWKGGVFSEEIDQKFEAVVKYISNGTSIIMNMSIAKILNATTTYFNGLLVSVVQTEPEPEPEIEPEPEPEIKPFSSIDDLIIFLDNDNVSDVIYASNFKCGDFATTLKERAHIVGYDIEVYSMFYSELDDFTRYVESLEYIEIENGVTITTTFIYGSGAGHAVCKTKIGSEWYLIEPQSDQVFRIVGSNYEIVYFGEVTK